MKWPVVMLESLEWTSVRLVLYSAGQFGAVPEQLGSTTPLFLFTKKQNLNCYPLVILKLQQVAVYFVGWSSTVSVLLSHAKGKSSPQVLVAEPQVLLTGHFEAVINTGVFHWPFRSQFGATGLYVPTCWWLPNLVNCFQISIEFALAYCNGFMQTLHGARTESCWHSLNWLNLFSCLVLSRRSFSSMERRRIMAEWICKGIYWNGTRGVERIGKNRQ